MFMFFKFFIFYEIIYFQIFIGELFCKTSNLIGVKNMGYEKSNLKVK